MSVYNKVLFAIINADSVAVSIHKERFLNVYKKSNGLTMDACGTP